MVGVSVVTRTHISLVSHILRVWSVEEVEKSPVSCGYHCTFDIPCVWAEGLELQSSIFQ